MSTGAKPIIETSWAPWIFTGAIVCFSITILVFLTRNKAYVQASSNHIRVVTPPLQINISYRRIRNVRPANLSDLYNKHRSGQAQHSSNSAYNGKTVIIVGLNNFPMSPRILRLFMPKQMFSPKETGLVLLVPEWMSLSTEIESYIAAWRYNKKRRAKNIFTLAS
jgi:hypothetical protein